MDMDKRWKCTDNEKYAKLYWNENADKNKNHK